MISLELKEQLTNLLKNNGNTDFQRILLDSLTLTQIILCIEEYFGSEINNYDLIKLLSKAKSLDQLFLVVEKIQKEISHENR